MVQKTRYRNIEVYLAKQYASNNGEIDIKVTKFK